MKQIRLITCLVIMSFINFGFSCVHANQGLKDPCLGKTYKVDIVPEPMSVAEKKLRFRCLVEADIKTVYSELVADFESIQRQMIADGNSEKIKRLWDQYKVESNQELLAALKPHPRSITIAQAALESAWGTSRFFREANNLFGIRPYHANEPRIAAKGKNGNKTIWLKKYASIKASIADYYLVLGRGPAYQAFRNLRMKTVDPHKLVKKLNHYSERYADYGKELSAMIRYNKFYELD